MRDWESTFVFWSKSPSSTEQQKYENAIKAIRDAISANEKLKQHNVSVFLQGSYRNRVNVRNDSDVDVGIVCTSTFFADYPQGTTKETFGGVSSDYFYLHFKNEVEEALVARFGREPVVRRNKSFDIHENTYRVDSDVAAFFEYRLYLMNGMYIKGVALYPDNDGERVVNFPDQHYENGVSKNNACGKKYKRLVRVLKKLSIEMENNGIKEASGIPGFLCECIIWNVPNPLIVQDTFTASLRSSLLFLYQKLGDLESDNWKEVSNLKLLFQPGQKWSKKATRDFVMAAWRYVGFE